MIYQYDNYITKIGFNCLTACVRNYLQYAGYNIREEDLFCCTNSLEIDCTISNMGLTSPIYEMIFENCREHNINFQLLDTNSSYNELKNMIYMDKMILACVDTNYLKYTNVFSSVKTNQKFHSVNIIGEREGFFWISDGLIPSRPPSKYDGWCNINKDEFIENSTIYILEIVKKPIWNNEERIYCMKESVNNYFEMLNKSDPFQRFIDEILRIQCDTNMEYVKARLMEYAVSIAVGGVISSRKVFLTQLRNCGLFNNRETLEKKYEILIMRYGQLKLALVKCHFSQNSFNFRGVIKIISEIKKTENEIFSSIF